MDRTEAAQALGEEQLLKQWRKVKQALKEAKMNVKARMHGNQLLEERPSEQKLWDRRPEILPKHQEQIQEQRNLGHGRSEATVRVGIFLPQDGEMGDTKQAVNVVKRTELTSSCMGIVMVSTRNLETVVIQRQYSQNPVLVLVPGSREQNHDAFDVIKLDRMQEVMIVVSDPKKPEEPEERGRSTLVTTIQMRKGTIVCKTTEADVANVAVDDSMEVTISLLGAAAEKNVWSNALKNLTRFWEE